MDIDRRRFERLTIPEDAVAVDENGRQLGRVVEAGGGGMLVAIESAELARDLHVGRCLRVTIVEPTSGTATVMDVEVKYATPNGVGMEFISLKLD
jgi:hypothetical protein